VGHFFGLTAFAVIMGMMSLIQAFGCASGALISGLIYDSLGSYDYALVTYICIYIAAIISIFLAGKPKPYAES
ncbi:MAG: hypothetical protein JRI52_08180, partial [Deltaproteobacteria bacterium]|nr:hypothetical protein [Deltaproteobacteria bacterium]